MQFSQTLPVEAFISEAIGEGAYFWVPGLAQLLTRRFWQCPGFSPSIYGSLRWLHSDSQCCRTVITIIDIDRENPVIIEALPQQTRQRYEAHGLQFLPDAPSPEDVFLFQDAFTLFKVGAGLFETVVALVRVVHLLAEPRQDYDTSHSDPDLPCSIFVSVPTGQRHAELRLAESILHEAMHLQLTMLEKEVPLVHNTTAIGYSPWQRTDRPVNGLLHGLFVFCVIDQWLGEIMDSGVFGEEEHMYITKRRVEIADEIAMVCRLGDSPTLTKFGRRFATWLLGIRR